MFNSFKTSKSPFLLSYRFGIHTSAYITMNAWKTAEIQLILHYFSGKLRGGPRPAYLSVLPFGYQVAAVKVGIVACKLLGA